jgi:hypothetical protein
MWRALGNGREREPLKHPKRGEYRDVPVPSWLWEMVMDLPDGLSMPGLGGKPFQRYGTIYSGSCGRPKWPGSPTAGCWWGLNRPSGRPSQAGY